MRNDVAHVAPLPIACLRNGESLSSTAVAVEEDTGVDGLRIDIGVVGAATGMRRVDVNVDDDGVRDRPRDDDANAFEFEEEPEAELAFGVAGFHRFVDADDDAYDVGVGAAVGTATCGDFDDTCSVVFTVRLRNRIVAATAHRFPRALRNVCCTVTGDSRKLLFRCSDGGSVYENCDRGSCSIGGPLHDKSDSTPSWISSAKSDR